MQRDLSWMKLPVLRDDALLWVDTSGYPRIGHIVPCLLCGDPFIMRPFIGQPDQVCSECKKTYDECATVVCQHCDVVICRLTPKTLSNGYTIQKRTVLHSDSCNICNPGLTESHIVEITAWETYLRPKKIFIVPGTAFTPRKSTS